MQSSSTYRGTGGRWLDGVLLLVGLLTSDAFGQLTNSFPGSNFVELTPDYLRHCVYALDATDGTSRGKVVALNSTNGTTIGEIEVGVYPTDMQITPAGDALYVINTASRTISKLDLDTFTVVSEQPVTSPMVIVPFPMHVAVGKSNVVYYTDGAWAPSIVALDFVHGTNVTVFDNGGDGSGTLATTRDGNTLYSWRQYGWNGGSWYTWVTRYDVRTSAFIPLESSFVSMRSNPVDSPVLLNVGETVVCNKQQMFIATNVTVVLRDFPETIYAISLDGSLAFGPTTLFDAQSGAAITSFPFSTTVQTLSDDQKRLLRYDAASSNLVVYEMAGIAETREPAISPTPADGLALARAPTNVVWTASPVATAYDVYVGTNQAGVAAASRTSSEYAGRVTKLTKPLGFTPQAGRTYFWRVDVVGYNFIAAGTVWSFSISPLSITPAQVGVGAIAGYNTEGSLVALTSPAPLAWSVRVVGASWATVEPTNGSSPATLTIGYQTAGLAAGRYTNAIQVTVGEMKVEVPITVDIRPLNLVKMAADYRRPYIYALQAAEEIGQDGQLLFINTETELVEKILPIGVNPTDLTVHYGEDRLYVACWGDTETSVIDLNIQTVLPPLQLGTDIYQVNMGPAGRLVTEGKEQYVALRVLDTSSGAELYSAEFYQGDGESDFLGSVFYEASYDITSQHLDKFAITNDALVRVAYGQEHGGYRNIVVAPDGTAIYWGGIVHDPDIYELGDLGEEIYSTTAHGDIAFGDQHAFNARNGQIVYTWPFWTRVVAISGDQRKVFLFDPTEHRLQVIPMGSIADVPGPRLNPTPSTGSLLSLPLAQLSWTKDPFGARYEVYFGTNQTDVAGATVTSAAHVASTVTTNFSLPSNLQYGVTYYWRVDSVGPATTTTGAVWDFKTFAISVSPRLPSLAGVTGLSLLPITLSFDANSPIDWALGAGQPWASASVSTGSTPSSVTLWFQATNLVAGIHTNILSLTANGETLHLPIVVQMFDLVATRMATDPNRNYIYVLHRGSGNFEDAFLLFLNTDTGIVEKVIPIGSNPTDLTVNRFEDRLYVSNWRRGKTRVVDLKTRSELPSLPLGPDIFRLNAGKAGRLVTEARADFLDINLMDSAQGNLLARTDSYQGDGEFDPTGTIYYHASAGLSSTYIHKYGIANDTLTQIDATAEYEYGEGPLVVSADGSRLFWNGYAFNAELDQIADFGYQFIYASSRHGSIAFGAYYVFEASTGNAVYEMPTATSVMAVDRRNERLWYYNPTTHRIENVTFSSLISVGNAFARINDVELVYAGEPVCFDVGPVPPEPNVSCVWDFGDGSLASGSDPCHVFTNCGPYTVGVTIVDGAVTNNATVNVAVPCAMAMDHLSAKLNFAKGNRDKLKLTVYVDLPGDLDVANKPVTFDIGGVRLDFGLDSEGRGDSAYGSCRLTPSKKDYPWRMDVTLRDASLQSELAAYGLVNTTIKDRDHTVDVPVIVIVGDQTFVGGQTLRYKAKAGKSGTAK